MEFGGDNSDEEGHWGAAVAAAASHTHHTHHATSHHSGQHNGRNRDRGRSRGSHRDRDRDGDRDIDIDRDRAPGQEEGVGVVLSLDEVSYDRDMKWVNVPVGERKQDAKIQPQHALVRHINSITSKNDDLHSMDQHYRYSTVLRMCISIIMICSSCMNVLCPCDHWLILSYLLYQGPGSEEGRPRLRAQP
jgi:hypothetical protein